jgi:hypothetical protein
VNYFEISGIDVIDPARVGMGSGRNDRDEYRVCIALDGTELAPNIDGSWREHGGWISLTEACAVQLHELLTAHLSARGVDLTAGSSR